jgi:DNA-binding NtrC family response regulator
VAGDAMEALEVLSQRRCAVVLADYQLPGTNGLDLLAALRGAYPDDPLILYSASMTPELAATARDVGVAALLARHLGRDLGGAVRAAVIDDDDLGGIAERGGILQDARQGDAAPARLVVGGDDDGKARRRLPAGGAGAAS